MIKNGDSLGRKRTPIRFMTFLCLSFFMSKASLMNLDSVLLSSGFFTSFLMTTDVKRILSSRSVSFNLPWYTLLVTPPFMENLKNDLCNLNIDTK